MMPPVILYPGSGLSYGLGPGLTGVCPSLSHAENSIKIVNKFSISVETRITSSPRRGDQKKTFLL